MKYLYLILLLVLPCMVRAQAEKLCVHEMEFAGDVFVKANLPCSWKKEKIAGNEESRKFLYTANGVNYTAVVVVSKLPVMPDSATRAQMISEQSLREAGKTMGTVISAGKIKMGNLDAGELIFKGVRGGPGAEKKYGYMLQCHTSIDDKLIMINLGVIAATDKLAQAMFEKNKNLFRQYVNKVHAEIDYSRSLMR